MSTPADTQAASAAAPLETPASLEEAIETGFLPADAHYRLTGEFKDADKGEAPAASREEKTRSEKEEASAASGREETADEKDADTAAASAAAHTQKDEKKGAQKTAASSESRWAKITRENKELRERIARIEAAPPAKDQARDTQQVSPPAADAKATSAPRPKIDDLDPKTGKAKYASYADYDAAKDEWLQSEAIRKFQETSSKTEQERAQREAEHAVKQGFAKKLEPVRTKYADFDQVALNPDLVLPKGSVADAFLLDSDHAGEVLYHLGQHPEILAGFYGDYTPATGKFANKITPQRQFRKLMEIEAQFAGKAAEKSESQSSSAKPVTQAPRPPHQVSGQGAVSKDAVEQAVEDGDVEAYMREQNQRELARRKRK